MKKLILSCLFLGLVACNDAVNTTDNQKPKVISTSTIIADLTARVGGEEIDHQDILKPGDDPHVYEPVPADSVALEKADLILYNGYNLEPGLIKMIDSTAVKAKKVAVGEAITPLQLEKEGQKVPDPHVWGSAKNGIIMVKKIRDQLIELSPEDKEIFTENAAQLIRELENLDRWITAAIKTIPPSQRQLVTTHDAFQYYAHAYGLKVAGTLIGISTEEQPSAQTVKNLADAIKNLQVPAIFAETTINPALITTVAAEAGVKLAPQQLYSDSIGAVGTGGDSYVKMLRENTRSIVESLGGKVPQEGQ
ncbi:MAG: zinc ABC transporter solute-binding protein [Microcystis aeruginosa K13-05]|jgi:manganese/iron transport system substrate-binding protein|uniref:metal ABC transporter solute-binding protein, Zn/Mn family n=1 Tax=unclassified Microcystis TaxID=2643300 RepID=UPI0022BC9975|nr:MULTISPECIES: zinc ABC transporter substrate-binding protein [unclassified Microcystis]MCZ8050207.1 zinc ABC transporter substrate-binding protein [Microcystis sp. LE19-41.2A]MCZ8287828.1 zinc ABC transporter substrate-binding protein [Microcystis sp. LE19-59.1C]NCR81897.1 zinc ABC transporter solute-binding protein [Microcystis aeruginosa K13-10]NCR86569.1 zinc ABC transporter solute-binding protein [Microcystis aeruginosa K13-05]